MMLKSVENKSLRYVRDKLALWEHRVEEARAEIQAVSIFGIFLQSTVFFVKPYLPTWAVAVLGASMIGMAILYMLSADRLGVWNKKQQHKSDNTDNYFGPSGAIQQKTNAVIMATMTKAINEGWDKERIQEEMDKEINKAVEDYRHGIDMDSLEPLNIGNEGQKEVVKNED